MKTKILTLLTVILLCFGLASCGFIKKIVSVKIDAGDETQAEPEPFDPEEAYKIIPRLQTKYFLSSLDKIHLQNACGIYRAVSSFETSYTLQGSLSREDAADLFNLVKSECPELFQLGDDSKMSVEYSVNSNTAKALYWNYRMDKTGYDAAYARADAAVKEFLLTVEGLTDYEKETKAFEYIASHCVYEEDAAYGDSAYGSLILGHAKCDGISSGFKWLCEASGIPCLLITAASKTGGVGHAWNMVGLDGGYYNVDLTQSVRTDSAEKPSKTLFFYFNVPDAWMNESYAIYEDVSRFKKLPACDTCEKSYYAVNGIFIYEGEDPYGPLYEALASERSADGFDIHFESVSDAARFSDVLSGTIKAWLSNNGSAASVAASRVGERLFSFEVVMKS